MKLSGKGWIVWRLMLPPLVLGVAAAIAYWMIANQPEPRRGGASESATRVEVMRLERQDYPVTVESHGSVKARTESTLIPQVSGRIEEVASNFREGGFFEKGDLLVRIDPSDYETAKVEAERALAEAQLRLAEEKARAEQARREWERLGNGEAPSELVTRKPQLADAQAAVDAARARLEQAKRNLERTRIRAPYDGRVLEKEVDVGQFVNEGTVLARVYAVDYAEIRLPLTDNQMAFVDLPVRYRGAGQTNVTEGPPVLLKADFGREQHTWEGRVVRTEGAVDSRSRQLFVVAQVDDPYGLSVPERPPLKVGMFVEADIEGKTLQDVFVIPRETVRQRREVLLVDKENRLERRRIDVIWSNEEYVIARKGLHEGELLCLTPMSYAAQGARVEPHLQDGSEPASEEGLAADDDARRGSSDRGET